MESEVGWAGGGSVCWVMREDIILSVMVIGQWPMQSIVQYGFCLQQHRRKFPHHKNDGRGGGLSVTSLLLF
jgi:hypothetical protein